MNATHNASATHETDVVVYADDIALRAAATREHRGVTGLGIAVLRAGAVDVNKTVVAGTALESLKFKTCCKKVKFSADTNCTN